MRVFVLEDDPRRLGLFAEMLIGHDWDRVDSCADADKFAPPYDVVFLDHDLGGRQMEEHEDNGLAFVRLIKRRLNADAKVVVHSYNQPGAIRMIAELDGNAEYQPFNPEALKAFIG